MDSGSKKKMPLRIQNYSLHSSEKSKTASVISSSKFQSGRVFMGLGIVFLLVGIIVLVLTLTSTLPGYYKFVPEEKYVMETAMSNGDDLFYLNGSFPTEMCKFRCSSDWRCAGFERDVSCTTNQSCECRFKSKIKKETSSDVQLYYPNGILKK